MSGSERPYRIDYTVPGLEREDLDADPLKQLDRWLAAAFEADIQEAHAACLSTVGADGRPSSRMVLVRAIDGASLCFFTNYQSRKGRELASNPLACLNFYWPALHRQVRVEGTVAKTSESESDGYFQSRPRQSRLASAASPQSSVIGDSAALERKVAELAEEHPEEVPRPSHWGGYRLVPDRWEFWQGQPARLHDRFQYRLADGLWVIERLAP